MVWRAWQDSDQVKKWWGPVGFTCPIARMDFRESGTSLAGMRAPSEYSGIEIYNTRTYTKIIPNERIEFISRFADQHGNPIDPAAAGIPPGVPDEVSHGVTFKTLDNGKTEMQVYEYGCTDAQTADMSRMGQEQCMDKLAASLNE